eukprot:scaffold112618_cov30-Tisochrysis_lutea.AAC.6
MVALISKSREDETDSSDMYPVWLASSASEHAHVSRSGGIWKPSALSARCGALSGRDGPETGSFWWWEKQDRS